MARINRLAVTLAWLSMAVASHAVELTEDARLSTLIPAQHFAPGFYWARPSRTTELNYQACLDQVPTGIVDGALDPSLVWEDGDAPADWLDAQLGLPTPEYRVREYTEFNQDRFLTQPFLNRIARAGDRIETYTVPDQVYVLTQQALYRVPYAPGRQARDYLLQFRDEIRSDAAWVIQPWGQAVLSGLRLYNATRDKVAPGALLFAPPAGLGRSDSAFYGCIADWLGNFSIADWARLSRSVR